MKKVAVVAVATMVCAASAFGVSITVPFFNDGADLGDFVTPDAQMTFIGVRNLADDPLVVSLSYWYAGDPEVEQQDATPAENTFALAPGEALGFRPGKVDEDTESMAGQQVPVMIDPDPEAREEFPFNFGGSVTLSWERGTWTDVDPDTVPGEPGDLVGRLTLIGPDGNWAWGHGINTGVAQE